MEQLTKDAAKARSVIQPFRNHKVDFTPPQITEKVPLFGTDKCQQEYIFKSLVHNACRYIIGNIRDCYN